MIGEVPFERASLRATAAALTLGAFSIGAAVASADVVQPAKIAAASLPSIVATAVTSTVPIAVVEVPCAPRVAVLFTPGEGRPPVTAPSRLASLVAWLKEHPDASLLVNGHADATGDEDKNLALSHRRARAVAKLLENAGIARTRITTRGFGAFQPLEGEAEESADNRRVNLRVRGVPACSAPEEVIAP